MTDKALLDVRRFRESRAADLLTRFREMLEIPSSSDDPAGLDRNAIWIRDALNDAGARAAVTQVPGAAPVVFGRIPGAGGGPAFGVYGHFDSGPGGDANGGPRLLAGVDAAEVDWPAPGEPVDPNWRITGPGCAGRAPLFALVGALAARAGRTPEATVVLLLEGEADAGSPHLPEYLGLLGCRLAADFWVAGELRARFGGPPAVMTGDVDAADRLIAAVETVTGNPAAVSGLPDGAVDHLAGLEAPVAIAPMAAAAPAGKGESVRIGDLWYGMDLMATLLG